MGKGINTTHRIIANKNYKMLSQSAQLYADLLESHSYKSHEEKEGTFNAAAAIRLAIKESRST